MLTDMRCVTHFKFNKIWWCSILVSNRRTEGGPKRPPTSISMKFLVPAFVAQTGVGAGS